MRDPADLLLLGGWMVDLALTAGGYWRWRIGCGAPILARTSRERRQLLLPDSHALAALTTVIRDAAPRISPSGGLAPCPQGSLIAGLASALPLVRSSEDWVAVVEALRASSGHLGQQTFAYFHHTLPLAAPCLQDPDELVDLAAETATLSVQVGQASCAKRLFREIFGHIEFPARDEGFDAPIAASPAERGLAAADTPGASPCSEPLITHALPAAFELFAPARVSDWWPSLRRLCLVAGWYAPTLIGSHLPKLRQRRRHKPESLFEALLSAGTRAGDLAPWVFATMARYELWMCPLEEIERRSDSLCGIRACRVGPAMDRMLRNLAGLGAMYDGDWTKALKLTRTLLVRSQADESTCALVAQVFEVASQRPDPIEKARPSRLWTRLANRIRPDTADAELSAVLAELRIVSNADDDRYE